MLFAVNCVMCPAPVCALIQHTYCSWLLGTVFISLLPAKVSSMSIAAAFMASSLYTTPLLTLAGAVMFMLSCSLVQLLRGCIM